MILPDANLLLYATDSESPFHKTAKAWWRRCLSGSEPVGLCAVVVFAYLRLGTSPRAFRNPLSVEEATRRVRRWLGCPEIEYFEMTLTDVETAMAMLEGAGAAGNLTTDAQIAAMARRLRATIHTADTDFQRFAGVKWFNPILGRQG
ncbi:MAG: PIN domain-containing protein [Verrucomicrobiae bacterium]|nr:PIN domain-containing protein [Verrucomicrobiae bacterium]